MDYIIENTEIISLAGTTKKFRLSEAEKGKQEFWTEITNNGALNAIHQVKEKGRAFGGKIVAVWQESDVDPEQIRYFIGTEYSILNSIYALELKTIPAHQWLVFRCAGVIPQAMNEAKTKIFNEVLPSLDYQIDNFHLEVYTDENHNDEDYRFEIWIPIKEE